MVLKCRRINSLRVRYVPKAEFNQYKGNPDITARVTLELPCIPGAPRREKINVHHELCGDDEAGWVQYTIYDSAGNPVYDLSQTRRQFEKCEARRIFEKGKHQVIKNPRTSLVMAIRWWYYNSVSKKSLVSAV